MNRVAARRRAELRAERGELGCKDGLAGSPGDRYLIEPHEPVRDTSGEHKTHLASMTPHRGCRHCHDYAATLAEHVGAEAV